MERINSSSSEPFESNEIAEQSLLLRKLCSVGVVVGDPLRVAIGLRPMGEIREPRTYVDKQKIAFQLSELVKLLASTDVKIKGEAYQALQRNKYFRAVGVGLMYHLALKDCALNQYSSTEKLEFCKEQGFVEVVVSGKLNIEETPVKRSVVSVGRRDSEITGVLGMLTWLTEVQRSDGRLSLPPTELEF